MSSDYPEERQLRVAFYIRVSTEDQVERYGSDAQLTSLKAMIASKGSLSDGSPKMILAGEEYIYRDMGVSGTAELLERPAFRRLSEDIENSENGQKHFDVVAVYRLDRFARKLKILLEVVDYFKEKNINFISVNESIDTSSPFGNAILSIVGALSELELATIQDRTFAGRNEAIKNGVFVGNAPPYGYIKDENKRLAIHPDESIIVEDIFYRFTTRNESYQAIADSLSERKIPSPGESAVINKKRAGKINKKSRMYFWSTDILKDIIQNEIYIGNYYYDKTNKRSYLPKEKWKLSPYKHPAIINQLSFFKAQDLLSDKIKFSKSKKTSHVYILSGLLKCTSCFDHKIDNNYQSMNGERKRIPKLNKFSHYYKCRRKNKSKGSIHCTSLPLPADQMENYIVQRISELIDDPSKIIKFQKEKQSTKMELQSLSSERNRLTSLINSYPNVLENLLTQHKYNYISTEKLNEENKRLKTENAKYHEKLKEIDERISLKTNAQYYAKSLEVLQNLKLSKLMEQGRRSEVQEILRMVIDRIIMHSRDLIESDQIAGRKVPNQAIPYKIDIHLKLPKEYMDEMKSKVLNESKFLGYVPMTPPENLSNEELEKISKTRAQYTKEYQEYQSNFGDKTVKWWVQQGLNLQPTS